MGALSAGGLIGSLSTAATVLKTIDSTFSAIQSFGSNSEKEQQDLALKQLQQQQGLSEANAAQDAALQRQQVVQNAADAEATRLSALRRAVARQNAQNGASGLSSDDGSSEAVLLGLSNQSQDDKDQQDALDNLRYQAIDQNVDQQRSVDVLQQAQLQQKQNLQRIIDGA